MRVKTDYVPESSSLYLSPGKEYVVVSLEDGCGEIIDDNGGRTYIRFKESEHINGRNWQIIDEINEGVN